MTEAKRCVQSLHWLFDKKSHSLQIEDISQSGEEVIVKLSEAEKSFKITQYLGTYDLLEQICQGIEDADNWRR